MADPIFTRIKRGWNAFLDRNVVDDFRKDFGPSYNTRPDRVRLNLGNEKSIVSSVYTRIGIDVSTVSIQHVRLDEDERYAETVKSGLNECLTLEANIDQTARAFMLDVVLSMFDEGCVAIVPVDSMVNPTNGGVTDILTMRSAKIIQWYPQHVRLSVYNDRTGLSEEITLPKRSVVIVENPLYAVMNETNSTLKRLVYKLNLLDAIDEQSSSGKLDLIIQLPYTIRTDLRRAQAESRRAEIEKQLQGSKYGIAYTDGAEKVTQLNRPAENNLMKQIEYLTNMLYSQLGLTEAIFNGTASEEELINYYNRTVEPVIATIADGMRRTFLTKTARSQGQSVKYFRDPFKLVPAEKLAQIADSLTRNEILTGNEFRAIIGRKPSKDPAADELRNKNLNQGNNEPNGANNQKDATKGATDNGQV